MAIPYKDKRNEQRQLTAVLFAIGTWLLLFSLAQVKNGKTYLAIVFPQFLIFVVLGLLTALVEFLYFAKPLVYCNHTEPALQRSWREFWRFLVMAIACTGTWQCVLLPVSGLGFVEYGYVLLLLIAMLSNYHTAKRGITIRGKTYFATVHAPVALWIIQAVLFLIKAATWFMPENSYATLVTGNGTARLMVVILFVLLALATVKTTLLPIEKTEQPANKNGGKVAKVAGKFFSFITALVLSLGPGTIIMLVISVLMVVGTVFVLKKTTDDIEKIVGTVLRGLFSTGKFATPPSSLYLFAQIGALILAALDKWLLWRFDIDQGWNLICDEVCFNGITDAQKKRIAGKKDVFYNAQTYNNWLQKIPQQSSK